MRILIHYKKLGKSVLLFLFAYAIMFTVFAQTEKFTISGYVKEANTGEFLLGANVYIKEHMKGTTTNQYGFYSLTIEKGKYTLVVSYLGYEDYSITIDLGKNSWQNISLTPKSIITKEVEIVGEREDRNTQEAQMGSVEMNIEKIKSIPAFMGEVDIMKTIQLLPGVQSAGDGNAGFYVRGGGPDQNLILLDEAVVYNAAHLFGFFSIFNGDAVKNIELIKGGMPANYGGRLASVLDVTMNEGNSKQYKVDGGIGVISSRLTVQGPVKKDTSSFIVSGRRTYIDVLTRPFISDTSRFYGSGYFFYDLNTKINYRISDKDRIFLSGYFGRDVFTYKNKKNGFFAEIPWGNATSSLRWNHLFSNRLFLNSTIVFTDYNFNFKAGQGDFEFVLFSGIRDYNAKLDFNYFPSVLHNIKFGANYVYHTFTPSSVSAKQGDTEFDLGEAIKQYAHESAIYVNDEFDITENLKINAGMRYSMFTQVGPFKRYIKDVVGANIKVREYKTGEEVITYSGLEPRYTIRYNLNAKSSLKGAFTHNYQYIHLASLSSVSLPTDVWVPSSDVVKPQIGTQYAGGFFRNFKDNKYESSVEVYYKTMKNMIEYEEGYAPEEAVKDNTDNHFVFGKGWSYGAEFFLKKRTGKTTGWIGYTWSKTLRQFDEINNGKEFPAKFDRRHDFVFTASHDLTERWALSSTFVFATGNAITLPVQRYIFEGNVVNVYGERNSHRMPSYHRLDLSATYKLDQDTRVKRRTKFMRFYLFPVYLISGKDIKTVEAKPKLWAKKFTTSWNFSVFNVYNRANPFFIYFDNTGDLNEGTLKITAKQVSLFPILPSITWNFNF